MGYREDFVRTYLPFAQAQGRRTGIDPYVILSQAALESNWGRSKPGNNLFGIKGKGTVQRTKEQIAGKLRSVVDSFRAYASPAESFQDYGSLMLGKRYANVRAGDTAAEQLAALGKSGYATDPNYTNKLSSIYATLRRIGGENGGVADTISSAISSIHDAIRSAERSVDEAITGTLNEGLDSVTGGAYSAINELFTLGTAKRFVAVFVGIIFIAIALVAFLLTQNGSKELVGRLNPA